MRVPPHVEVEQPELHVRPDRRANYDTVAKVLALAQRNGMQRIERCYIVVDDLETAVGETDTLVILPAMAGGTTCVPQGRCRTTLNRSGSTGQTGSRRP